MGTTHSKKKTPGRGKTVTTDAEETRLNILEVATEEFADKGLSGARVDEIAAKTRASKRMIYYYFGGKQALYRAVLEKAYADIRNTEARSDLAQMPPVDALRRLIEVTFDYDESHKRFVRLVSIENIHRAQHLQRLPSIQKINASVIHTLEDILERGRRGGVFRSGIEALDVHMLISAMCFFRVSNRHTFEALFECDLSSPALRNRHRNMVVNAVLNYVAAQDDSQKLRKGSRGRRSRPTAPKQRHR